MAVTEGLVLNGVDLNDGVNFTLRGLSFPIPKKRQEWAQAADADGAALVRDPLFDNRQIPARVRINPAGTLTMDQALAKLGSLVDQLEESERQVDGLPLVWTPAQGTKSITFYVVSAQYDDLPIEKSTQNSGWFLKSPMFGFTLDCKPFGYGQAVDTILDDFSSDSIGAGKYTFDLGTGLSVSGGQLVPSDATNRVLYRSGEGLTYGDLQLTLKYTTGAAVSPFHIGLDFRVDGSNYLRGYVDNGGNLSLGKVDAGVGSAFPGTSSAAALVAATTYWLRVRVEGNKLTAEHWTSAPSSTGSPAVSVTYTLAGADATKFGQGVLKWAGMRLQPAGADWRFDDFQVEPNVWKSSGPVVLGVVPNIGGDIPAEGRHIITDAAGQVRQYAEFGCEQRYYSPGVPTLLDQFGVDTIGPGAWAFDLGSGTIAVSGGQLVPSTTAEKRLYRTDSAAFTDTRNVVKIVTGASVASGSAGFLARRVDANNYLRGDVNFAGVGSQLTITRVVAGTPTSVGGGGFTTTAATSYWLEFKVQGTACTLNLYTADPATGAAVAQTLSYTLTAAEAAALAAGNSGLRLIPQATDYRYDDFRVLPLLACTELLIDSESLVTTGFGGTQTTRAGASTGGTVANHVVRGTLSTTPTAIASTGNLGHVGTFRVKARVYASLNAPGFETYVRISWQEGDGPFRANDWALPVWDLGFAEIDLGLVTIPAKSLGAQKWSAKVEIYSPNAGSTLDVDYLELIPTEVYGKGRAPAIYETVTAFSARDEFNQTAGALTGKTAPVGGVWAGAGVATDFSVETTGNTAQRTAISDAGAAPVTGRVMSVGSSLTDILVDVDFKFSVLGPLAGVMARYVDANNWLAWFVGGSGSGSTTISVGVQKAVAGVLTQVGPSVTIPQLTAGVYYTLRLLVDSRGRCWAWLFPRGSPPGSPLIVSQDAALATGGALQTGKGGFYDHQVSSIASTRNYDNFVVAAPTAQFVLASGLSAQIRNDLAQRQDASGAFYGPIPLYRGGRLLLPPAGAAGRSLRLFAKARRNDVDAAIDDQIADATISQLLWTPRYLAVPR